MSNKSFYIWLLVCSLVFVFLVGLSINKRSDTNTIEETTYSFGEVELNDYELESDWRVRWTKACMSGGGSYEFCKCIAVELTKDYTLDELDILGEEVIEMNGKDLPDWAWEITIRCAEYYFTN